MKKRSFLATLEWTQTALNNAKTKPEINETLSNFGITADVLEEGTNLYNTAKTAYRNANEAKKKQISAADSFKRISKEVHRKFLVDLKTGRFMFMGDDKAQEILDLNTSVKQNRLEQFERAINFYNALSDNPELLKPLESYGITEEYVKERLALTAEAEEAKNVHVLMKGVSQNATTAKYNAFSDLRKWMSHFFNVSKVALEQKPQMMEALGLVVKN